MVPTPAGTSSVLRAFSTTPANYATTKEQRRRRQDPYAQKQADARKAANLSRQSVLDERRKQDLGDPVRGVTTPFVQSFDNAQPVGVTEHESQHLNHYFRRQELDEQLGVSAKLVTPSDIDVELPARILEEQRLLGKKTRPDVDQEDANATAAIERIVNLSNSSSKDRTRVNIRRCIGTFGRHETDMTLPPRAQAATAQSADPVMPPSDWEGSAPLNPEAYTRGGPDTGSSEVQIAILTAKIRALADFLESRGKNDKVNKRNLRLLVHRRQKLLRYLQRKERGGPRWQNLIETLGLTEGTWKGEISM